MENVMQSQDQPAVHFTFYNNYLGIPIPLLKSEAMWRGAEKFNLWHLATLLEELAYTSQPTRETGEVSAVQITKQQKLTHIFPKLLSNIDV